MSRPSLHTHTQYCTIAPSASPSRCWVTQHCWSHSALLTFITVIKLMSWTLFLIALFYIWQMLLYKEDNSPPPPPLIIIACALPSFCVACKPKANKHSNTRGYSIKWAYKRRSNCMLVCRMCFMHAFIIIYWFISFIFFFFLSAQFNSPNIWLLFVQAVF